MKFGRTSRTVAACAMALILAFAATPAWSNVDDDDPSRDMSSPPMFDLFILRPLGITAGLVGTALFIAPVAPIALITRPSNIGRPFDKLVAAPARYVFVDPLGEH